MRLLKKPDETTRRNLREWAAMAVWISGAILLSYGVFPHAVRWLSLNQPKVVSQIVPEHEPVEVLLVSMNEDGGRMLASFVATLEQQPLGGKVSVGTFVMSGPGGVVTEQTQAELAKRIQEKRPRLVLLLTVSDTDEFVLAAHASRPAGLTGDGPQRYLARLPLQAIQASLVKAGFDTSIDYVDLETAPENMVFYRLFELLSANSNPAGEVSQIGMVRYPRGMVTMAQGEAERALRALRRLVEASIPAPVK